MEKENTSGTVSWARDLTGHKYGMLTVLSFHSKVGINDKWLCKCDCGKECVKYVSNLKQGHTKSCGCVYKATRKEGGKKNAIDLTGRRFSRLVVTERVGSSSHQKVRWLCKCDCGNEKVILSNHLLNGNTTSCGCVHRESMSQIGKDNAIYELTGKRFERLLVIEKSKDRYASWRCVCDCGKEKVVTTSQLVGGKTRSCGCLQREVARKLLFNPNLTDEERRRRGHRNLLVPGVSLWRKAVIERDGNECAVCGKSFYFRSWLVAHHKESWKNNPALRLEVKNGGLLCDIHHREFHHKYGWGDNTTAQWDEFIASKQSMREAI